MVSDKIYNIMISKDYLMNDLGYDVLGLEYDMMI
jgi:hypothetical protein